MKVTKGKAAARKDKKEALKPVEDRFIYILLFNWSKS